MRGADLSVVSSPESGCTAISRADRNRRLASVSPSGRLVGPVVVSVVQSGTEASKLAVVYEKSDKPSLLISTLEALAVLFSLMLFFHDVHPELRTKVQVAPTWTDNRGNGSALNKLMTSRYPASAVLVEMSALLKQRGLQASVQWAPRTANRVGQRVHAGLQTGCECVIDPATVPWILLCRALDEGRQAEQAYQDFRASGGDPLRGRRQRRRRPDERLRMMDPW